MFKRRKAIDQVLTQVFATRQALLSVGVSELEVVVVDDASTDSSWSILQRWSETHQVVAIHNRDRKNYGGSLKAGFEVATGDVIGFMDMDGTYLPREFPSLIQVLDREKAAIVCGDRLSRISGMPWLRFVGNRLYVGLIKLLFGQHVADCCTGQRVFRRELIEEFCDLPVAHLNFSLAMTLHCLTTKQVLIEEPVQYDERIGQSKLSVLIDGPRFLLTILTTFVRRRSTAPSIDLVPD